MGATVYYIKKFAGATDSAYVMKLIIFEGAKTYVSKFFMCQATMAPLLIRPLLIVVYDELDFDSL